MVRPASSPSAGSSGDSGAATSAQLVSPIGVALDAAGNLFIADTDNNRIRKVTTSGVISTVAGTGASGSSGDSGAATSAQLNRPFNVTLDAAGNLFVADTENNRIRKVDSAGVISTVAGAANGGFSGDGGPATSAQLNTPTGVAVDAVGNLFIADANNNRIRKVLDPRPYANAVGAGSAPLVLNPTNALGAPDGQSATVAQVLGGGGLAGGLVPQLAGGLVLDMGAGEEGIGDLKVYYSGLRVQGGTTVDFLDVNGSLISSASLPLLDLTPGAHTVVATYGTPSTPYRFVRLRGAILTAYQIDAVETTQLAP